MKKFLAFILISVIPVYSFAQNLVPNPSFENYTYLTDFMLSSYISLSPPWFETPAFPGGQLLHQNTLILICP